MVVNSLEYFAGQVRERWLDKLIRVTKTNLMPPMEVFVKDVKISPSCRVDGRIREKYPENSRFLVLEVKSAGAAAESSPKLRKSLVIHVDEGTVFDVRERRLVLLSDEEVIQFQMLDRGDAPSGDGGRETGVKDESPSSA
ncbi:MAG: hypothetical protein K6T80_02285 [Firmicutes bacterium]|nr:hypothetical protein [Bacillota bacterium]